MLFRSGALHAVRPSRHGGVREDRLPGVVPGLAAPPLPGLEPAEEVAADLWATGMSPARHPTEFVRPALEARGVVTTGALRDLPHGEVVEVAGLITHRQAPETAGGVVFLNLEDEDGLVNVICTPAVWRRFRRVARAAPAVCVRGVLERRHGVVNLLAQRVEELVVPLGGRGRSRDFR